MPIFIAFAAFMLLLYGQRLGLPIPSWPGFGGQFRTARKSPGQKSGVRTEFLEMTLDHDSGSMDGRCLKGRFAGRTLSSLSEREVADLLDDLGSADNQGSRLLEAYLDRSFADWRERHPTDSSGAERRQAATSDRMTLKGLIRCLASSERIGRRVRNAHRS